MSSKSHPPVLVADEDKNTMHESVKYMLIDRNGNVAGVLQENSPKGMLMSVFGSGDEHVVYELMNKNSKVYNKSGSRKTLEQLNKVWKINNYFGIIRELFKPMNQEQIKKIAIDFIDILDDQLDREAGEKNE